MGVVIFEQADETYQLVRIHTDRLPAAVPFNFSLSLFFFFFFFFFSVSLLLGFLVVVAFFRNHGRVSTVRAARVAHQARAEKQNLEETLHRCVARGAQVACLNWIVIFYSSHRHFLTWGLGRSFMLIV
jgi:hypothetical protein